LLMQGTLWAQEHPHHLPPAEHPEHQPPVDAPLHPAPAASPDESPRQPVDHAATGHEIPAEFQGQSQDHAAMGHGLEQHDPAKPREPIPPLTDADRVAAFPEVAGHAVHDESIHSFAQVNRLESWRADGSGALSWEGQGWVGRDLTRLWWRSEGERMGDETEAADLELLYGRVVGRWWDLVAGGRQDFDPGDAQTWAAIGLIGLAPYKFELEVTAYLGESGQTAARIEVEYELLLTNRLILQPLLEVNLYGKDDPERGFGSGLSSAEVGARLRYEFTRKFAPYLGVVYECAFGETADLLLTAGEDRSDTRAVAGLRFWF
jgi:copper resistance protein B